MHALLRWLDSPLCPIAFPSVSDRWFPAPEGEGPGVGTVLSFISLYLLSFNHRPRPYPRPCMGGEPLAMWGLIVYSIHNLFVVFYCRYFEYLH